MVDRTKLAVFLGHHAETRAVEVSKRRGQIWACSLLAETGHVQVGGDEVAVGKGRGEVGGRGPPSRALVADVEALGQAMKDIGDKGGIRVVGGLASAEYGWGWLAEGTTAGEVPAGSRRPQDCFDVVCRCGSRGHLARGWSPPHDRQTWVLGHCRLEQRMKLKL